jgi:hypothetical protein
MSSDFFKKKKKKGLPLIFEAILLKSGKKTFSNFTF